MGSTQLVHPSFVFLLLFLLVLVLHNPTVSYIGPIFLQLVLVELVLRLVGAHLTSAVVGRSHSLRGYGESGGSGWRS